MASINEMVKSIWSVFVKAALLASVAVVVHALEPGAPPAGPDVIQKKSTMCQDAEGCEGKERMCDKKMKEHHDKMAAELKLDDKQRQLFEDASAKMHGTMKDGMSLHRELKELVHSDQYDEKQVRALVQKHNAGMEEKTVAAANAMHAFHASLSPEQKEKYKAMKSEMREKMKQRMQSRKDGKSNVDGGESPEPKHPHEH